jgi:hypothetical protein
MRKIGYLLIAGCFLAASLVAVLEATEINWMYFVPLFIGGFAGVAMVRAGTKQEEQSSHRIEANIATIHKSLANVVSIVGQLNADKGKIDVYDMRHKIDDMVLKDIDDFVEARETIGHKYGLQHYADVMSHFAAGERYLNRVWSCSADGYIDEVNAYLDKSLVQFTEALDQLKKLEASHP